jgi:hypothetical protein
MQELGVRGLAELRERGDLTAGECAELLAEGLKLEGAAAPGGTRKRRWFAARRGKKSIRPFSATVGPEVGASPWNRKITSTRSQHAEIVQPRELSDKLPTESQRGIPTRFVGIGTPRGAASKTLRIN